MVSARRVALVACVLAVVAAFTGTQVQPLSAHLSRTAKTD